MKPDPCPHCGSAEICLAERQYGSGVVATCQGCTARIWGSTEDEAIVAWNRRTPGTATQAMIDLLERQDHGQPIEWQEWQDARKAFLSEWNGR